MSSHFLFLITKNVYTIHYIYKHTTKVIYLILIGNKIFRHKIGIFIQLLDLATASYYQIVCSYVDSNYFYLISAINHY